MYVAVPDDGFKRQRVSLVIVDSLMETLCSRVYVGKEGDIVSVERVKVAGELRSTEEELSL